MPYQVFSNLRMPSSTRSQFITPSLGLRMFPHLESSGMDLDVIDDVSILDSFCTNRSNPVKKRNKKCFNLSSPTWNLFQINPSSQFFLQTVLKLMLGLPLQQYPPETIRNRMPVVSLATAPFTQLNFELFF